MPSRYFEDFAVGDEWTYEPWSLSETEIVEFGERYDPQPMHTMPGGAPWTSHGAVIASGWQTALNSLTPFLREVMSDTAGLASPGFESFGWLKPVGIGQPISSRIAILETRRSRSKPDRGVVRLRFQALDDGDEPVWEAVGVFLIACRDPA